MFVEKSVKMHSVACKLSEAGSCRFFLKFICISIIHPQKNLINIWLPHNLNTLYFLPGEIMPTFTIGKIHKFLFEFLSEIFLLFRRVINGIKNSL